MPYCNTLTDPTISQLLIKILTQHKLAIIHQFYDVMLTDPETSPLLASASVEHHLKPGLMRWLDVLLQTAETRDASKISALHQHVAATHARANISVKLVAKGMRILKNEIADTLKHNIKDGMQLHAACLTINNLLDLAFEEMCGSFTQLRDSDIKTDESFRLYSSWQNMHVEREKEKYELLDWENKLFKAITHYRSLDGVQPIGKSPIGLWIRHKAPLMFNQEQELALLDQALATVDHTLFPQLQAHLAYTDADQPQATQEIVSRILIETEQIKYLLVTLFDHAIEMETGKDALTQLFNRKYLPTILKREIELSRRSESAFAILMIDIDKFKSINDQYGHTAGDQALQQVATELLTTIRAGDFAFRYGGEEFLVVLSDLNRAQALAMAEKIRARVEKTGIQIAHQQSIRTSISIGVSMSDGNPDFQRIIDRADQALYQAKSTGRNRVMDA